MAKRGGAVELAVLGLLHESPMHGYELRKRVSALLGWGRVLSYGSLYPALKQMRRAGWLTEDVPAGGEAPSDPNTATEPAEPTHPTDPTDPTDPTADARGTAVNPAERPGGTGRTAGGRVVGGRSGARKSTRASASARTGGAARTTARATARATARTTAGRRGRIVYKLTAEGKERFEDLMSQGGPSAWEDDSFGVHFAFFAKTDVETRMRILEGRRTRMEERLERLRTSFARSRERVDAYTLELQRHGLESVEREVSWLKDLIDDERSRQTPTVRRTREHREE